LVKSRGLLKTTSKTYTQIIGESRRNGWISGFIWPTKIEPRGCKSHK
jgi:hypothetical protein